MADDDGPKLILPGEFTDPSGLVRLTPGVVSLRGREEAVVRALAPPAQVVAMTQPPSFFDQVYVYATHHELRKFVLRPGLSDVLEPDEITSADVIEAIKGLPFEPAMRFAASVQRALRFGNVDANWQRRLVIDIYGTSPLAGACEMFLRSRDRAAIFSEQQLFALQRLLVLHASDEAADDLTPEQQAALRRALLYIPGTVLQDEVSERAPDRASDEYWLRYFVSLGSFAAAGNLKHDLARAHRLYEVIAKSRRARRHVDFCPLDQWLTSEYGFSFLELQALGIALHAGSKAVVQGEMPVAVTRDYFASAPFGDRVQYGLEALVADRAWYREQFSKSPEDPRRAAFEIQPFLRRPGLRQRDGSVVTLAPRAIGAWLSATGTYYRLLDIARSHGDETWKRFTRFNGFLEEAYARHLVQMAHPRQRLRRRIGSAGRVHGEMTYTKRKNELKTSDTIVDLGADLVLIEMTAKRLTEKSIVEADADEVRKDVQMMIIKKMGQLGRVIRDIFEDPHRVPELDLDNVKRVWPIVVSSDGIFHSPSVWGYTLDEGGKELVFSPSQVPARVQPHILLDLEELELLAALIGEGDSFVELLERKTHPLWRERDFKTLVGDEWAHRWSGSPRFIDAELKRALRPLIQMYRVGAVATSDGQQRAA